MSRTITDEEIRHILIERKIAEKEAADNRKWQNITEWLEAFTIVGWAFIGIIAIL